MSVPPPPPSRTAQAQVDAIRRLRGPVQASGDNGIGPYAGLVTRTVAFALDGCVVNGVAAVVGVTIGLGVSILHLPSWADAAIAAIVGFSWIVWSFGYFVFFWSTTGQTPGSRLMSIRVIDIGRRGPLKPRRALVRFGALIAAVIPLGAGILMMLWDRRGRCLQDHVARTLVVYVPPR